MDVAKKTLEPVVAAAVVVTSILCVFRIAEEVTWSASEATKPLWKPVLKNDSMKYHIGILNQPKKSRSMDGPPEDCYFFILGGSTPFIAASPPADAIIHSHEN